MSDKQQTEAFATEVAKLVEKFAAEYDLSYAVVIGVLQLQINDLCAQAREESGE